MLQYELYFTLCDSFSFSVFEQLLQTKLGQTVTISENQITQKDFEREGLTLNSNYIKLKTYNQKITQCEHLQIILKDDENEKLYQIILEENVNQDPSLLLLRLGFQQKNIDLEYNEKEYEIKFMRCKFKIKQKTENKNQLTIQLRDNNLNPNRILLLGTVIKDILKTNEII